MVKESSGSDNSNPDYPTVGSTLFRADDGPTDGIVEERWNGLRHGDGQGYLGGSSNSDPYGFTAVGNTSISSHHRTNGAVWKSDERPQAR